MTFPQVSVLMSTYNGEKYIREQIDSILAQKEVEIELLIRDDGSCDSTPSICKEYEENYSNVTFYQGENIGVGKSFLDLLRNAPEAEYYAFADQDDVWLNGKIKKAIITIQNTVNGDLNQKVQGKQPVVLEKFEKKEGKETGEAEVPILYGSNLIEVDKDLNVKGLRFKSPPKCDLLTSISRNVIYGCTMVMNKVLRDICIEIGNPSDRVLERKNHDAWVLYVAYITGIFVYDNESFIYYREHERQVVGVREIKGLKKIPEKTKRFLIAKNKGIRSLLARDLLERLSSYIKSDIKEQLVILSESHSLIGAIRLLRNHELSESFGEPKWMILLRGMFRWI